MAIDRRLVATIACRNNGSRLFGKPLQNLDVKQHITVLDQLIQCLRTVECIDEIVLGISVGDANEIFKTVAADHSLKWIVGNEVDVLGRLISCAEAGEATDIFRVTSESPFPYFEAVESVWTSHLKSANDATFFDNIVDGCGFEIIKLSALQTSHQNGEERHRSELCTLYIRENLKAFKVEILEPSDELKRFDLRLTVDNPEDLVLCRQVYEEFIDFTPRIPLASIVKFLDSKPHLRALVAPYTEAGYKIMYIS